MTNKILYVFLENGEPFQEFDEVLGRHGWTRVTTDQIENQLADGNDIVRRPYTGVSGIHCLENHIAKLGDQVKVLEHKLNCAYSQIDSKDAEITKIDATARALRAKLTKIDEILYS